MLKGNVRRILLIAFSLLCVLPLSAQNEAYNSYSPYSMFGIGDISRQGSAYNKSMGGVGIATRDKRALNYLNPAAVTARDKKTFMADFSLAQGNRYYKQGHLEPRLSNTLSPLRGKKEESCTHYASTGFLSNYNLLTIT